MSPVALEPVINFLTGKGLEQSAQFLLVLVVLITQSKIETSGSFTVNFSLVRLVIEVEGYVK